MRNSRLSAPTACIRAQIVQHALLHSLALAPCGSRDRPHTTAGVSFLGVRKLLLTDLPADPLTFIQRVGRSVRRVPAWADAPTLPHPPSAQATATSIARPHPPRRPPSGPLQRPRIAAA